MWKEVPRTRKKEVLSSHRVESSRLSLTTVSLEVLKQPIILYSFSDVLLLSLYALTGKSMVFMHHISNDSSCHE